jgi:predicted ATP-dependent serine protease
MLVGNYSLNNLHQDKSPIKTIRKQPVKSTPMKYATVFTLKEASIKRLNKLAGSKGLNGFEASSNAKPKVMSSVDFSSLEFDSIGFKGKWKKLIGDPSVGFSAMIFGKPKMGKSYLAPDFAGYLANNHGSVLYVAAEEKLDATLQKKLLDKNVASENLYVSDSLPKSLKKYDFVFIDSINKIRMTPMDVERLRLSNKGISFVFIFQTTKQGQFRGGNEFQHDVDIVIEIPEKGKAIQFGRFNQGGHMKIFK